MPTEDTLELIGEVVVEILDGNVASEDTVGGRWKDLRLIAPARTRRGAGVCRCVEVRMRTTQSKSSRQHPQTHYYIYPCLLIEHEIHRTTRPAVNIIDNHFRATSEDRLPVGGL